MSAASSRRAAWLVILAASLASLLVCACAGPTRPYEGALPAGRWSGSGACLSVGADVCDLVVGCGHGQFPVPILRGGTFVVDGTYRIEAGPVGGDPAPPATFSGVLNGDLLIIRVTPTAPSLVPASYVLEFTNGSGKCTVPCV
jgi:hypothetical protein